MEPAERRAGAVRRLRGGVGGTGQQRQRGRLSDPLATLPADLQQSFFDYVTGEFTGAWQTVLWVSAVIRAALSVTIYLMLGERGRTASAARESEVTVPDAAVQATRDAVS